MKRREFSLTSASVLAGSALVLSPVGSAHAQGKPPVAGTDYLVLDKPVPTEAPAGKVEVIEFFWYACPHCFAFEPALTAWLKKLPKNVAFRRVPVVFQDSFVPPQKLYYTLEAMGQLEAVHEKVFNAIHVERQKLDKDNLVIEWAAKQGLDKAKFVETYNSFSVATKVRKAAQLQEAYKVAGVPAMGVAGRFYTDGTQAQSMERGLTVVDYLVSQQKT
ncbi:thiol:disulfide interchange protein DsbA/DsbL [Rhodoferax sp. WC2427]|uniref:thiol:disulfide interchange protein DsbA/DsbL n=1 Tax=Rhodoferax sp. WC2427 TaxID=3234144 RepID=UPI0034660DBB